MSYRSGVQSAGLVDLVLSYGVFLPIRFIDLLVYRYGVHELKLTYPYNT